MRHQGRYSARTASASFRCPVSSRTSAPEAAERESKHLDSESTGASTIPINDSIARASSAQSVCPLSRSDKRRGRASGLAAGTSARGIRAEPRPVFQPKSNEIFGGTGGFERAMGVLRQAPSLSAAKWAPVAFSFRRFGDFFTSVAPLCVLTVTVTSSVRLTRPTHRAHAMGSRGRVRSPTHFFDRHSANLIPKPLRILLGRTILCRCARLGRPRR
jgi:hypothetical protein